MEAFLISTGIVALVEIGDKTQLLLIPLAACLYKPVPITLGIFISTLVNYALAGAVGGWITHVPGENVLRWILGAGFIAMVGWMLIPDKLDDDEAPSTTQRGLGILGTTIVVFFFAEIGDRMQIAAVALAVRFNNVFSVVAGTTVGMPLVNVLAVLMGNKFVSCMPIKLAHRIVAPTSLVLGVLVLLGVSKQPVSASYFQASLIGKLRIFGHPFACQTMTSTYGPHSAHSPTA